MTLHLSINNMVATTVLFSVFPQQAAGIFKYLKENFHPVVQSVQTSDLTTEMLQGLSSLMLAQAQESFFQKARQGMVLWYSRFLRGGTSFDGTTMGRGRSLKMKICSLQKNL